MLYPGYESWSGMQIIQRSLEDFSESTIFENKLLDGNCVNCHTFLNQNPEKFFLHVRGSQKGTYFVDGKTITRRNLRTENMIANAVHPTWHPDGRFIVFSSNEVVEVLHMIPGGRNEIYDRSSSLVIYDSYRNTISGVGERDTIRYMDTFPCWDPAGKHLYFCRAAQATAVSDGTKVRYDLVRKSFDQSSGLFGNVEMVMDANEIGKSISFPRISPDGKYLVFVLHDYGTFPIWHKDADLYLLNLDNGNIDIMNVNSEESESYHTWSSNGKWIVFSSKRGDGVTARPYFAYFGSPDDVGKPFVLPQKDPTLYNRLDKTFNIPEFVTGKISINPRDFAAAAKKDSIQAIWEGYE
jgi:hypothetical protein